RGSGRATGRGGTTRGGRRLLGGRGGSAATIATTGGDDERQHRQQPDHSGSSHVPPPSRLALFGPLVSNFVFLPGFRPLRRSRSTRSTRRMIRSPEISIPAMITAPNTTFWRAVDRPSTLITWLSQVMKNAAEAVAKELARPPVREAPPMTTAAIGPSR